MSMQIKPILAALRWHKAGTVLVVLQIALTLAIVCNALFLIRQRMTQLSRPTGLDEAQLVVIDNSWVGSPSAGEQSALLAADLATLRRLPSVLDAAIGNTVPLNGPDWLDSVAAQAGTRVPGEPVSIYLADAHALQVLGLKLVAGRDFRADEIVDFDNQGALPLAQCIVSQALSGALFPQGGALGHAIYLHDRPCTVIGVVVRLQGQMARMGGPAAGYSLLLPLRAVTGSSTYLLRVRPGMADAVTLAAPKALQAANRMRLVEAEPYADIRARAYDSDRGLAIVMAAISVVLLAITAAGVLGLTSFWVGQRRKQIGIRRALGATRGDILGYFLTENLLIAIGGAVLGALLGLGLNLWLALRFQQGHMPLGYVGFGVLVLLLLGQTATLAPALHASRVPPVEATRSV